MSQRLIVLAAATAAAALAVSAPAQAQSRVYSGHGGWVSQYDQPGDYRCDAYWDASRTDCQAGWRDQRRYTSRGAYPHGQAYGYGHGYTQGYGHAPGYAYGHGRPHDWRDAPAVYPGAYGRPDLIYPGGGAIAHGYGVGHPGYAGGRDPARIAWCRAHYRSYDAHSGYYTAYSGRRIFCG